MRRVSAGLIALVTAASPIGALSQSANAMTPAPTTDGVDTPVQPDDATTYEVASYAKDFGLSEDEAALQLSQQQAVGDLARSLRELAPSTFGGLFIDHQPSFHVVIYDLGGLAPLVEKLTSETSLAHVVAVQATDVGETQLRADIGTFLSRADQLGTAHKDGQRSFDAYVDLPNQTIVVQATKDSLPLAESVDQSGLKSPIRFEQTEGLSSSTANTYGGLDFGNGCTSGFSVARSNGGPGVITAGHCPNFASYAGVNMPFKAEHFGYWHDAQWFTAGSLNVKNGINDGINDPGSPYFRSITGQVTYDNQHIGDYLCKYGLASGTKCGTIYTNQFAPSYVPYAMPTFIQLRSANPAEDISVAGDSGGPEFYGANAYGINSGETGPGTKNDAIYEAIDYATSSLQVYLYTG
jgi:hypothetical protein